jgi:putative copper export protein
MKIKIIKNFILRIPYYLSIILQLHSKSPNKEIKRNWEIFALSGLVVVFLTVFSGAKIWFIPTLKIDLINNYGVFIFFIYTIIFCIVFFDNKKCKEITEHEKHSIILNT